MHLTKSVNTKHSAVLCLILMPFTQHFIHHRYSLPLIILQKPTIDGLVHWKVCILLRAMERSYSNEWPYNLRLLIKAKEL